MNKNKSVVPGLGLVALGIVFLAGQFIEFDGRFFLSLLGIGFIVWSLLSRTPGLLIPGGILSGIGLGIVLIESTWTSALNSDLEGAFFLLSFAAGWFSIILFSKLFFNVTHWWPAIPGGIMALIGVAVWTDGILLETIGSVGRFWPIILIVIGFSAIWKQFKSDEDSYEKQPESWQIG